MCDVCGGEVGYEGCVRESFCVCVFVSVVLSVSGSVC